jgi:hypothetical protein
MGFLKFDRISSHLAKNVNLNPKALSCFGSLGLGSFCF